MGKWFGDVLVRTLCVLACIFFVGCTGSSQSVFSTGSLAVPEERTDHDGLIVFEAEDTRSDLDLWIEKDELAGFSGSSYLEFTGNRELNGDPKSPLEYPFSVTKSGRYYLHMHVAKETVEIRGVLREDVSNDGYIRLEGEFQAAPDAGDTHGDHAPLSALTQNTKYFGGKSLEFAWATGNRLDLGGHNNKRIPVYHLIAGEPYVFVLSGRSKRFKVDRFVFRHEDVPIEVAENLDNRTVR